MLLSNMLQSLGFTSTTYSHFLNLPTEVLLEIAVHVAEQQTETGYATGAPNLAVLSRVSRRLRTIALPIMHRNIILTSEKQLKALRSVPEQLLGSVR